MADATYGPKVYRQQGGDRMVVASGGSLDVESGGEIDIESGGALKIAGVDVTPELAALNGVTASAAELNILDGVTASTAELNILDGVTATAAELNILDGVTATAAELNILDGVTATAAEVNALDGAPMDATLVVGAEGGGTTINVAIQLKDLAGDDLAVRGSVLAYLSDDANGDSIAAAAPSGGWAIGTDGLLIPVVANKCAQLVSEADGDIDVNVVEAGAATWYVILVLPNGKLKASGAVTFAP